MRRTLNDIRLGPGASIRDAMLAIDRGAVEIALMVDGKGVLIGTVTDGDIRRALLGGARLGDAVAPCMQREFTSVRPEAGRAEVLDIMRARVLRQIPVVDADGKLVGLHLLREVIGSVERSNWAVIMAGGLGMRLRPITDTIPKPMLPVAGRPILERLVLHLVGHGFRRIYLAVNYLAEVIEEHFGDGERFGCEIRYLREKEPLGTAGALSLLAETPEDPLLVLNGDLVTQFEVGAMLDLHSDSGAAVTIGVFEHRYTVPYGVVSLENGVVTGIAEKPTQRWVANTGIYVIDASLVAAVPQDTFFPMTLLVESCLKEGRTIGAYPIDDWLDVGRPPELRRALGREV